MNFKKIEFNAVLQGTLLEKAVGTTIGMRGLN